MLCFKECCTGIYFSSVLYDIDTPSTLTHTHTPGNHTIEPSHRALRAVLPFARDFSCALPCTHWVLAPSQWTTCSTSTLAKINGQWSVVFLHAMEGGWSEKWILSFFVVFKGCKIPNIPCLKRIVFECRKRCVPFFFLAHYGMARRRWFFFFSN